MTVRRVPASVVHPVRTKVLRPGWPPASAVYADVDDRPGTVHVAAFDGDAVAAVGTAFAEAPPSAVRAELPAAAYAPGAAWRLRGMASTGAARGRGFGRAVLDEVVAAAREAGATVLWCNARLGAVPFYERQGLATAGAEFDIPEIGPHYVMWRALSPPLSAQAPSSS